MSLGGLFFSRDKWVREVGDGSRADMGEMGGGSESRKLQSGCIIIREKNKQTNKRCSSLIKYLGIFQTWKKKQLHTKATAPSKSALHKFPGYKAPMEAGYFLKL